MGSTAIAIAALYPVIVIVGLTNTIGYHRLLTHHSFKTRGWLRATITIVCAQYSGSPMAWVGAHRVQRRHADVIRPPHPRSRGWCGVRCPLRNLYSDERCDLTAAGLRVCHGRRRVCRYTEAVTR